MPDRVGEILREYWGFDTLRPLQHESIAATLDGRDSLTVMPTGGGKSLCYQLPPLVTGRLTLVVSPLIALMQDQVAGLSLAGVPAGAMHSLVKDKEQANTQELIRSRELRLLFVSPEKLLSPSFLSWVVRMNPGHIAIDEAHCISQWGHDFRPEYRLLSTLRGALPKTPIGAYTATATPRVREDIVAQLSLRTPAVLVGRFDRPNLTYRVQTRSRPSEQVARILKTEFAHAGGAAIVYCISRKETEAVAGDLTALRIPAQAYHAGLDAGKRRKLSEDFRAEKLNVICATVAFGMGIDRGDVRCVIHCGLPKSIEHYQQETGRAGRDGLPAQCVLLHSPADIVKWKEIMNGGASARRPNSWRGASAEIDQTPIDPAALKAQSDLLEGMNRFAVGVRCRHRALTEYFGQEYLGAKEQGPGGSCGACDVCLGELREAPDAHDTARKIISCVYRCDQRFGISHVADVLTGNRSALVLATGHDTLSTFGLLKGVDKKRVSMYIDQLIDAGHLAKSDGKYTNIIGTPTSGRVLKNELRAVLVDLGAGAETLGASDKSRGSGERALVSAERELFEAFRAWRRAEADKLGVPPFVVLGDAVLEEICRVRPGSEQSLINIRGIGRRKFTDFGAAILREVRVYCEANGLALDTEEGSRPRTLPDDLQRKRESSGEKEPAVGPLPPRAAALFDQGVSIEEAAEQLGRSVGTVSGYLAVYIEREQLTSIDAWVSRGVQAKVRAAIKQHGVDKLRPLWDALGGEVPYEHIRAVVAHHALTDDVRREPAGNPRGS